MATSAVASPTLDIVPTLPADRMPTAGADQPPMRLSPSETTRARKRPTGPASVTARNGRVNTSTRTTQPGGSVSIHHTPATMFTHANVHPASVVKLTERLRCSPAPASPRASALSTRIVPTPGR